MGLEPPAVAFQDRIPDNRCWGCGPLNPDGLQIKSRWDGDEAVCTFRPSPAHMAGPPHVLNGGIIATVLDCHAVCTAIADGYRREGREIGTGEAIWYATGRLEVRYLRPTPLAAPVRLRARIVAREGRKTRLEVTLTSAGATCAEAEVLAVRVPSAWRHGASAAPADAAGGGSRP